MYMVVKVGVVVEPEISKEVGHLDTSVVNTSSSQKFSSK
jgi:hypothetical protein